MADTTPDADREPAHRYDGFISYSHAADGRLAPAIQDGLARFAKPWWRRRALRIFRDDTGLSANPHLWSSIEAALADSDWFVLLASPDAAASDWVNRELTWWTTHRDPTRILPVVTDGDLTWDPTHTRFDPTTSTALPPALAAVFDHEPRWIDLRWARTSTDLDLHNTAFRDAIADLAAPLHGIAKDDLESEEIRQHRRTTRTAWTAATLLTLTAITTGLYALAQRNEAQDQARVAEAGRLAALSAARLESGLDVASLLAVEARRLDDNERTRSGVLESLRVTPHLVGFRHEPAARGTMTGGDPVGDGDSVIVGYQDGSLRRWDLVTGELVWERDLGTARVSDVAVTAGGGEAVVATSDDSLRLIDTDTGATQRELDPSDGSVARLEVSADGRYLGIATAADVQVRELTSDQPLIVAGELSRASGLAFSPTGDTMAVASSDAITLVHLDDLAADPVELERPEATGRAALVAVGFGPDGATVVAATAAGAIEIFEAATGRRVGLLSGHDGVVSDLVFSPDGTLLASVAEDRTLRLWDGSSGEQLAVMTGHRSQPVEVWFTETGATLWTGSAEELGHWSTTPAGLATQLDPVPGLEAVTGNATTGAMVVSTGQEIHWLDSTSGETIRTIDAPPGRCFTDVDISGDGTRLVTVAGRPAEPTDPAPCRLDAATVWAWDTATGETVTQVDLAPDDGIGPFVVSVRADRTGSHVALATTDGRARGDLRQIDLTDTTIEDIPTQWFLPYADYAPAADHLLVIDDDTLTLIDTTTLDPFATTTTGTSPTGAFFSPDGQHLLVLTANAELRDPDTLEPTRALIVDAGSPISAGFDPAGGLLAATTATGRLQLWDLDTGEPLTSIDTEASLIEYVAAGRLASLATGPSATGRITIWNLDPDTWNDAACTRAGRNLTPTEWDDLIGGAYRTTCAMWPPGR